MQVSSQIIDESETWSRQKVRGSSCSKTGSKFTRIQRIYNTHVLLDEERGPSTFALYEKDMLSIMTESEGEGK